MSFTILRDLLDNKDVHVTVDKMPLYGIERALGMNDSLPEAETAVNFRLLDDDGTPVLSGALHDDDDCENQSAALRLGESWAGATVIEVRRDGQWVREIA